MKFIESTRGVIVPVTEIVSVKLHTDDQHYEVTTRDEWSGLFYASELSLLSDVVPTEQELAIKVAYVDADDHLTCTPEDVAIDERGPATHLAVGGLIPSDVMAYIGPNFSLYDVGGHFIPQKRTEYGTPFVVTPAGVWYWMTTDEAQPLSEQEMREEVVSRARDRAQYRQRKAG